MVPKASVKDIAKIIEPIIEDEGMELVDLQFRRERGGWVLRLFVDKAEGVTLDDCAEISGQAGAILDVKEIIDIPYVLEVSSPGINRPLRKKKDFERFRGRYISLTTLQSINSQKNFKGKLMGLKEDNLLLLCDAEREIDIPLDNIARAHIDYQWDEVASGGPGANSRRSRRLR